MALWLRISYGSLFVELRLFVPQGTFSGASAQAAARITLNGIHDLERWTSRGAKVIDRLAQTHTLLSSRYHAYMALSLPFPLHITQNRL